MALATWVDFSTILELFGLQTLEFHTPAQVQIDPETNEEYYSGPAQTGFLKAVVFPRGAFSAEFLPQGVYQDADYYLYMPLNVTDTQGNAVTISVARGTTQPTVFIVDGETYAAVENTPWHAGNFRVVSIKKSLPGPPLG
jgi:hypothetical protein